MLRVLFDFYTLWLTTDVSFIWHSFVLHHLFRAYSGPDLCIHKTYKTKLKTIYVICTFIMYTYNIIILFAKTTRIFNKNTKKHATRKWFLHAIYKTRPMYVQCTLTIYNNNPIKYNYSSYTHLLNTLFIIIRDIL